MAKDSDARKRTGAAGQREPKSPSKKEDGEKEKELASGGQTKREHSKDHGSSSPVKDSTRKKRSEPQRGESGKSSTLVTVIAILVVAILVAFTYRQRQAAKSDSVDDVPPLEDMHQHSNSHGGGEKSEHVGQSGSEEREKAVPMEERHALDPFSSDQPEDVEDDYDNPDDMIDDEHEDEDDGADDDRRRDTERQRAGEPIAEKSTKSNQPSGNSVDLENMLPTNPMEEELGGDGEEDEDDLGDEEEVGKSTDEENSMEPMANSLMRPHEPVKSNFWKHVVSKSKELNGTELHQNIMHLDNVLSASECFKLIKYHEELLHDHVDPPPWCFQSEDWINRALNDAEISMDTETFALDSPSSGRLYCAKVGVLSLLAL